MNNGLTDFTSGFAENQVYFNLLKETVVEPKIL